MMPNRGQTILTVAMLMLGSLPMISSAQSRSLESLSAADLKSLAAEHEKALADAQLPLGERASRLSQQILIYRRMMQYRDALRAGLAYHTIVTRNGRNSDRLKSSISLTEDLLALGENDKAEELLIKTLEQIGTGPLDPIVKLSALTRLAGLAQQAGREEVAEERWNDVGDAAEAALKLIDQRVVSKKHRAFCLTSLATSQAARGEARQAIGTLTGWLEKQPVDETSAEVEEMHVEVARHYVLLRDYKSASRHLASAIDVHRDRLPRDPSLAGLYLKQAAVLASAGDREQSDHWYMLAFDRLKSVIPASEEPSVDATNSQLWEWFCDAQRHTGNYREALPVAHALIVFHEETFGKDHQATVRWREVLGMLYSAAGRYREALPLLRESVRWKRERHPPEPIALSTALIHLGSAELAFGDYANCRAHLLEAWKLRQEHLAEDDPLVAAVLNAVGNLEVAEGNFAQAIALYNEALKIYARVASHAEGERATLLNLAAAYRSQHQYDLAIEYLRAAHKKAVGRKPPLARAAEYNALAALHRLRGRQHFAAGRQQAAREDYRLAFSFSRGAWDICLQRKAKDHPEAASALNQLGAMYHLLGDDEQAQTHWREAAKVYQQLGRRGMVAQIRNALGVIEFRREDYEAALHEFNSALEMTPDGSFRPQLRYSTLCNLASVHDVQGDREKAIELLQQAVAIVETPRAGYLGDERQLAEFFARFGHAFDLLFAWHVEEGRIEEALALSERSRNRTLLDRMRLAGIDLRATVPGSEGEALRAQEAELRADLNALRSLAAAASGSDDHRDTEEAYRELQIEYARVWEKIRNASPAYRKMIASTGEQVSLDRIGDRIGDGMMLTYYVGSRQSFVIAIDGESPPAAFPLNVPELKADLAEVADAGNRIAANAVRGAGSAEDQLLDDLAERGLIGTVATEKGERLESEPTVTHGPLTRDGADLLVDTFRRSLENRFGSGANAAGNLLSRILLPAEVLELIRQRRPKHLIVIRDGPLRQLPWEALPSDRGGSSPRYMLDELPPIAYVPSASVWLNLVSREAAAGAGTEQSLLSIGNPAYSDREVTGFRGKLSRLPGTADECRQIAERFQAAIGPEQVAILNAEEATEGKFLEMVGGRKYIHIAAHGLIDQRHDNLFGAIALTPPDVGQGSPANDGFLEVREIQSLPLSACELAILSACQTGVGAKRPLEAGPSLAQAFLLGGARRVTASHWNVSDSSTAELMSVYMGHILDQAGTERAIDYAAALKAAKQEIAGQTKWKAPYYWSAFVLVGPAE